MKKTSYSRSRSIHLLLLVSLLLFAGLSKKKTAPPQPLYPVPSEAQLQWHEMEQNAFIHFTVNTFTDKEWGYGSEKESLFNPTNVDTDQWIETLKLSGFKGVILTCKHHDGFCLWPTKFSEHSIKNSPYKNGEGDMVKEVAASVRKNKLKFGIYVSPWDRNRSDYGSSAYVDVYRKQLKELFEGYGPIFEMWFDGANGGNGFYGGANEKRKIDGATYYHWPETLEIVQSYQPNVIFFSDAGPGVRWVGNEKGIAGETNWNTITPDTLYAGKAGIENLLNTGSEGGTKWIPAEVDVSIRPGWFYHEKEDSLVKSSQALLEIYLTSVGRGSTLLLNVPPDKRGLISKKDSTVLRAWKALLDNEFKTNLAANVNVKEDSYRGSDLSFSGKNITDGDPETYWTTDDHIRTGKLEINLGKIKSIKYIVLQEYIRLGQRVKNFTIEVWKNHRWTTIATATTIGYKRILRITPMETDRIRVVIQSARACPVISSIGVY